MIYRIRRVVDWCSVGERIEIVSIKKILQERYRFLAFKEISEILGVKVEAPAEDADSKDQITIDDII